MPQTAIQPWGRSLPWRLACAAAAAAVMATLLAAAPLLTGNTHFLVFRERTVHFVGHIVVFGVMAVLVLKAVGGRTAWAWLIANALAGTEELHQMFVPGRRAAIQDELLNIATVSLFLAGASLVRHGRARRAARRPSCEVTAGP